MPICKKCNKQFALIVVIDGKTRNLSSRSNCLDCVPFKTRSTIEKDGSLLYKKCVCVKCGKEYEYHHSKQGTLTKCNSCMANGQLVKRRNKALDYLGGKCIICGYDKCSRALSYHHIDPSTKLFGISGNHCRSWEVLKTELDKCVILCANCHMEVEDGIIDLTKYLAD
jgi:hypothetical protein